MRNLLKTTFTGIILALAGATFPLLAQQTLPIPAPKIATSLAKTQAPQQVRVLVTDVPQFKVWLQQHLPNIKLQETTSSQSITLTNLSSGDIAILQQCPWVKYIDRAHRQAKEELELKDSDLSANSISAVHALYPELNGTSLIVSVKENPFDTTDIDLKGRIVPSDAFKEVHSTHATTMATIIAGGGNSTPLAQGVAWGSMVTSSSFANLMPDETTDLKAKQVSVQSHSYGVGVENYYGLESMAYDEQALAYPELLHVFSSGNSGSATPETGTYAGIAGFANLTGQFKTSKNSLSVGALDADRTVGALSSVGPAYDGRVKPELVAHGVGGTSEAAAVAAGVATLVQQAYTLLQKGVLPPAALVKAVMINSADDIENPHVDFKSGFGNIDALGAVETIKEGRYFMGSVARGATDKILLQVPEGVQQLKVTLVWHDAASSPEAPTALVNDLDLRVQQKSTNQVWQPWVLDASPNQDLLNKAATRGTDHLNNVEQVTLQNPSAGAYELEIEAFDVPEGAQAYSVAYEYVSGLAWVYPSMHSSVQAGSINRIRWSNGTGNARLEYKLNGNTDWTLLSNVDLSLPYFEWNTPDTLALAQLRLVSDELKLLSPGFILSPATKPSITLNCDSQVLLQWAAVEGATQYQVYSLQGKYMQPLLTVTDTVAILSAVGEEANYLAVAPVLSTEEGFRSNSVTYNPQAALCYIYNFLPRQLVMDTVQFDLTLSTNYQLQEVALERFVGGSYKVVQARSVANQTAFVLQDPAPAPGLNRYRARVSNSGGQTYYSQLEDVFYTQRGFVQVAPNPVIAGQDVRVLAHGEGLATLQLFNILGQLVYSSTDGGVLKTMPTAGLSAGMYILRMQTEQGEKLATRLLVQ